MPGSNGAYFFYSGDTPENFAAFVKSEGAKWGRVAKEQGATLD